MSDDRMALYEAADALAARFGYESVVIIATKHDLTERETACEWARCGNKFACTGSVAEWLDLMTAPACEPADTDEDED